MENLTQDQVRAVLARVYADPHRFIDIVWGSVDYEEAALRVGEAFGLSEQEAVLPLNQQFRLLTRDQQARLRADQP